MAVQLDRLADRMDDQERFGSTLREVMHILEIADEEDMPPEQDQEDDDSDNQNQEPPPDQTQGSEEDSEIRCPPTARKATPTRKPTAWP